jgi:hypothetical protein
VMNAPNGLKLRCGARTRRRTAYQRKALRKGRCPNHGGLSTGPRTVEGMKRTGRACRAGMLEWWARWRAERARQERAAEMEASRFKRHSN